MRCSLGATWIDDGHDLPQNHFYEAGGTETATPGYLLVGASAGTDIVIKDKSRLKYIGVYNMGRNVTFKLVVPF